MDINLYALLTYALTAVISLLVIGVIVVINKLMSRSKSKDSD
jgi:hypothetical protein